LRPAARRRTDESKQLVCVENEEIGVYAFAPAREGLIRELESQVAMLWTEYAQAPDDTLDGPARRMKRALLGKKSRVSRKRVTAAARSTTIFSR